MNKLRIEMHSPPKENSVSKFENDNFTIFMCFLLVCTATVVSIYIGVTH